MRTALSSCSQDSSAASSQYWSKKLDCDFFISYRYIKGSSSLCLFFYSSPRALPRPPDRWDKVSPACYNWLHLVFSNWPPGTWCNQALRGECKCVWSCKPVISSAADDQVGGGDDLQKGHLSTSPWGREVAPLGFKTNPDWCMNKWVTNRVVCCTLALLYLNQIMWYKEYYRDVRHFIINMIPSWITP